MDGFDHILNWKLKIGSHTFPGRDGGTCINEAALVAAGFAYKPIHRVDDMPPCFSRPICRLAMRLNDEAGDEERQRLLPLVTRLACADTEEVERGRADYIRRRTRAGGLWKDRPRHDDASHGADAFLTFACSGCTPPSAYAPRTRGLG